MVEIVSHDSTEMVSLGLAALVLSRAKKVGPIMNAAFELVFSSTLTNRRGEISG